MTDFARNSVNDGADTEQVRLARSLVETLGLDGAIFACRANGWDGVLACLLVRRLGDGAAPPPRSRKSV